MFAYCLNSPITYNDKNGRSATRYGDEPFEDVVRRTYEWLTGEEHPSQDTERRERELTQKRHELYARAWNAYVQVPTTQQKLKEQETEMILDLFAMHESRSMTLAVIGAELLFIESCYASSLVGIIGSALIFWKEFECAYYYWEGR